MAWSDAARRAAALVRRQNAIDGQIDRRKSRGNLRSRFRLKRMLRQDFGKTATGPGKSVVPNQSKYLSRTRLIK